jgi:hypothetical protein
MRHDPALHGRCPIADDAPHLDFDNEKTVSIFNKVYQSGVMVEGEKKTYRYICSRDVVPLMESCGIPQEERESMYDDLIMLQDIKNHLMPSREK